MTPRTAPTDTSAIPGTAAIRLGIGLLATVAFALSYDALRQMAVAIHIRGLLTYTFPLVIDGFIAIGIGAQLMLRAAALRSRMYVGTLVGLATGVSIGANALHAIRLNQQTRPDGLYLDNFTVGALSALAPLALAGAVHLYLVIRRHPSAHALEADSTERHNPADHGHNGTDGGQFAAPAEVDPGVPETADVDVAQGAADVADRAPNVAESSHPSARSEGQKLHTVSAELLAIARTAPLGRGGRASRRHIEATIRGKGLSISRADAEAIKDILQDELDEAAVGAW
ncbi:DUF2637 domain-containing protein [Streptomyces ipomoeae]|uniref:DUF2637 domain-containing protein n=1 Tax=Streptomyces ipomoeae TaxID=103232 RepID=UPI0029B1D62F|nr:DUF2637 domain-containing protein [Streptomyces ipomoeae]MDX2819895.1 DUF2637 domain-containing protein [Streptomyces ipomoeae]MDX2872299.1 DUF2637 domain-containing protein [Streptomyces ipomoeae]